MDQNNTNMNKYIKICFIWFSHSSNSGEEPNEKAKSLFNDVYTWSSRGITLLYQAILSVICDSRYDVE